MVVLLEEKPVSSKGSHGGKRGGAGRPKTDRDDVTVKMDRTVVARARYVADIRGMTLAEFLTEGVRPFVDREFAKATEAKGGKP